MLGVKNQNKRQTQFYEKVFSLLTSVFQYNIQKKIGYLVQISGTEFVTLKPDLISIRDTGF